MHWAARFGQASTVSLLIDKGASLDARDRASNTPIHWAIRHGQTEIIALLKRAEKSQ